MKRVQLIAGALCLIMLLTVGAGAVAAQQENLRQADKSPIYFYDVKATNTHGTGKLQINVDKHTFEFNGKDFVPSLMVELKSRAADSAEYKVFATGKATPSGNLHITGTWEKGAALPADVVGGSYSIGGMILDNTGLFVAQLKAYYSFDGCVSWYESPNAVKDITRYHTGYVRELSYLGVPYGAYVQLHAVVVGGKDRTGDIVFDYQQGAKPVIYTISGVTWNPKLAFVNFCVGDCIASLPDCNMCVVKD